MLDLFLRYLVPRQFMYLSAIPTPQKFDKQHRYGVAPASAGRATPFPRHTGDRSE